MAAPLRTPSGVLGGLFVASRTASHPFSGEQERLLGVVAGAAGASLGNLLARAETDHSLRRRLAELQALARLAEQITRLTDEEAILDEVLLAVQELAGLEGAVYAVKSGGRWAPRRAAGLDSRQSADVADAMASLRIDSQPTRHDLDGGGAPNCSPSRSQAPNLRRR